MPPPACPLAPKSEVRAMKTESEQPPPDLSSAMDEPLGEWTNEALVALDARGIRENYDALVGAVTGEIYEAEVGESWEMERVVEEWVERLNAGGRDSEMAQREAEEPGASPAVPAVMDDEGYKVEDGWGRTLAEFPGPPGLNTCDSIVRLAVSHRIMRRALAWARAYNVGGEQREWARDQPEALHPPREMEEREG